jgi:hypothetical protein
VHLQTNVSLWEESRFFFISIFGLLIPYNILNSEFANFETLCILDPKYYSRDKLFTISKLTLSLPRYSGSSSTIHPSYSLYLDSLPSFLLVRVFVPFIQLYIRPFSFCSQWYTRSSGSISFSSSSSLCSFSVLYSNLPVSCTPFPLPLSFPLSLSVYSSCTLLSLPNLAFLRSLLAPISHIILHSLYLLLFLLTPDLCPVH